MPTMIQLGTELIRISPTDSKKLEYSTNQGRTWNQRFPGSSSVGAFQDLMEAGREILGTTQNGLYYSTSQGRNWSLRRRH